MKCLKGLSVSRNKIIGVFLVIRGISLTCVDRYLGSKFLECKQLFEVTVLAKVRFNQSVWFKSVTLVQSLFFNNEYTKWSYLVDFPIKKKNNSVGRI